MTAVNVDAAAQIYDALLSMGLSVIICFFYHLMILIFKLKSRLVSYAAHIAFFSAAGLFVFCFIVGKTSVGDVRWYIIAGFGCGAAAYFVCFAAWVKKSVNLLCHVLAFIFAPVSFIWRKLIVQPLSALSALLQKRRELRYNQRMAKRTEREKSLERDKNDRQDDGGKKAPLKAYTQT